MDGGSSGGGSINIFAKNIINIGNQSANGGIANGTIKGGKGGMGSISVGQIIDETYKSVYKNYD